MNFKKCPFCGKKETVRIQTASEFEEDYEYVRYEDNQEWHVVCDAAKPGGFGGCGASTGFFDSEEEAINSWNTRVK